MVQDEIEKLIIEAYLVIGEIKVRSMGYVVAVCRLVLLLSIAYALQATVRKNVQGVVAIVSLDSILNTGSMDRNCVLEDLRVIDFRLNYPAVWNLSSSEVIQTVKKIGEANFKDVEREKEKVL